MRALDWLFHGGGILAAIFLAAVGLLTLAQILGRLLGFLVPSGAEFAGFAMAASTFFALAWTLRRGSHIRVSLFVQKLQPRYRNAIEIWCLLIAAVIVGLLAYSTVLMVWDSYDFGDLSSGLVAIPLWIPQVAMALGVILLEIAILEQMVLVLRGREPTYRRHEDAEVSVDEVMGE